MRIAHVITRLIIGGAQENTLFSCQDLLRVYGDDVLLISDHWNNKLRAVKLP